MTRRLALAAIVALALVAPQQGALAAIPCIDQPVLSAAGAPATPPAQPNARPLTIEDVLAGGSSDTATTPDAPPTDASDPEALQDIAGPIENLVRCVLYGDHAALSTLVTRDYRVRHMGFVDTDQADDALQAADSFRSLQITWATHDGAERIQAAAEFLLDGHRLLVADLTFELHDDAWYLAGSGLSIAADVDGGTQIVIAGDGWIGGATTFGANDVTLIDLDNEGETTYRYTLTSTADVSPAPLRKGMLAGNGLVGPPDDSVIVLHSLEPGIYRLTLTPDEEGIGPIEFDITLT